MKIQLLATGSAPDYYSFSGEKVTAHLDGNSEEFDLSVLGDGDIFEGVVTDTLTLSASQIIRKAERVDGELEVTLAQQVGPGHWTESDWMDPSNYDPDAIQVKKKANKNYSGKAWVKTRAGRVEG